jgi:hypothetical protein
MTYVKKASFTYGELDPSLHDKTDAQTYYSGLKTALNVLVNKTGRVINNSGTWFNTETKNNTNVRIYVPDQPADYDGAGNLTSYVLEFGDLYVRLYNIFFDDAENRYKLVFADDEVTEFTTDDLPNLRFETIKDKQSGSYSTYVCAGWLKTLISIYVNNSVMTITQVSKSDIPRIFNGSGTATYKDIFKTQANVTAQIGTRVEYGITLLTKSGLESPIFIIGTHIGSDNLAITFPKLPVNDEFNSFTVTLFKVSVAKYAQDILGFNVYRRPRSSYVGGRTDDGAGFGLIGQTPFENSYTTGNDITIGFVDYGQEADFSNPPPQSFRDQVQLLNPLDPDNYGVDGIGQYNQRLIMYRGSYLAFSKINHANYLLRDFPLTNATCLILDVGESAPTIYHHVNYSGLYVFTSQGIYYGGDTEPVSSVNPILRKVNDSIIEKDLRPIVTPFGMFFVDSTTNTIKTLMYDDVAKSVVAEDISTASDHIFYGKKVVSWAFHGGEVPHLFVILDDGTAATFSYSKTTGLNAWTRHNTDGNYKQVINFRDYRSNIKYLMFVIERDGNYYLESSSQRVLTTPEEVEGVGIFTFNELYRTFSHSSVFHYVTNDVAVPGTFVKSSSQGPIFDAVSGLWDTQVKIDNLIGGFWTGKEGVTFAVYVPSTGEYYYMVVNTVVAMTSVLFDLVGGSFPVELRSTAPEIIQCHTVIDGLDHLEGKNVSVYSDNAVIGSPYNDAEPYGAYVVTGGEITLPTPRAYSVVGLPYISDIETLEIDTRNGSTALNNKIVNEVGVRYARTRGVYVSGELPTTNSVVDMENAQDWTTEDAVNRPIVEKTGLKVYRPTSTWKGKGKIALRQVDPLPFEVTSIILDVSKG